MPRKRDAQKFRCYTAESRWCTAMNVGQEFSSLEEMQEYVNTVHDSACSARMPPTVLISRARSCSGAQQSVWAIRLPSRELARYYYWNKITLLHALAHLYAPADELHGPRWAAAFLKLVRQWLGSKAAARLVTEWRRERVKYTMPRPWRRVTLTPEQRHAFSERMRLAREAKTQKAIN